MRWPGGQHLLFAVDQAAGVEAGDFESMAMRNCIRRAGLHTIPTKNTSIVVNVVDLGVAFGATDATFCRVLRGFDIDAIRGAGGCAQKTGYALFQAILVALQNMHPAETLL